MSKLLQVLIALFLTFLSSARANDDVEAHVEVALQLIEELKPFGLELNPDQFSVEVRNLAACYDDLDRQQDLFFEPSYYDGIHAFWNELDLSVGLNGAALRESSVHGISTSIMAYYQADRRALVFTKHALNDLMGIEHTVAHELTHAWQDQRYGLKTLIARVGTATDHRRVASCLIEGHAEIIASAVMLKREGLTLDGIDAEQLDDSLGRLLAGEIGHLPYISGSKMMLRAYQKGGWPAVLQRLKTPPPSTEQVLHPEKIDRDLPSHVTLPPWPSKRLGPATLIHEDTLGELMIYASLIQTSLSRDQSYLASAGWDGDALHVYRMEGERTAVLWRTLWDREEDARQFHAALIALNTRGLFKHNGHVVEGVFTSSPEVSEKLLDHLTASPIKVTPDPEDAESAEDVESAWLRSQNQKEHIQDGEWVLPLYGARLQIPAGWEEAEAQGKKFLRCAAHVSFADSILAQHFPNLGGKSLDTLTEENRLVINTIKGLKYESAKRVKLDGRDAVLISFSGQLPQLGTPPARVLTLLYLHKNNQVVISATVTLEHWEAIGPIVRKVLEGVSFDD